MFSARHIAHARRLTQLIRCAAVCACCAPVLAFADDPAPPQPEHAPAPSLQAQVDELATAVKVLERRAEVAEEIAQNQASAQVKLGDGLTVTSSNHQVQLKLGGLLQADGRKFFGDSDRTLTDQFLIRRLRLAVEGSYANWLKWQLRPEFVGGTAVTQDAFADVRLADWLTIRAGKQKVEFGLERAQNDAAVRFVERGYPTQLAPNRDVGVQLLGDLWGKRLSWAVGVFDGAIDNTVVEGDVNDSKEVNARVALRPFAGSDTEALVNLLVGGGFTYGEQDGTDAAPQLPSFKTPGQATFYSFRNGEKTKDASGASVAVPNPIAKGTRLRWTAHLWWNGGPFAFLGEYVQSTSGVSKPGTATGDWKASAWQAAASYVIGGKPTFAGTEVTQPFALGADGWGAVELLARVTGFSVDGSGLDTWADPAKAAKGALTITGGLRWHLSSHYRLFFDYEQTSFDGGKSGGNRPTEQVLLGRVQVAY